MKKFIDEDQFLIQEEEEIWSWSEGCRRYPHIVFKTKTGNIEVKGVSEGGNLWVWDVVYHPTRRGCNSRFGRWFSKIVYIHYLQLKYVCTLNATLPYNTKDFLLSILGMDRLLSFSIGCSQMKDYFIALFWLWGILF